MHSTPSVHPSILHAHFPAASTASPKHRDLLQLHFECLSRKPVIYCVGEQIHGPGTEGLLPFIVFVRHAEQTPPDPAFYAGSSHPCGCESTNPWSTLEKVSPRPSWQREQAASLDTRINMCWWSPQHPGECSLRLRWTSYKSCKRLFREKPCNAQDWTVPPNHTLWTVAAAHLHRCSASQATRPLHLRAIQRSTRNTPGCRHGFF